MKSTEITIRLNNSLALKGNLNVPYEPSALVIFSHGSGSSRFSPRNRHVADLLNSANIATLLTDLLTEEEDRTYSNRFNIELLTSRLTEVTRYTSDLSDVKNLQIGYFGASTGAASALKAAARLQNLVKAVVSRGGRPDLALDELDNVKAPTLLIVGGLDTDVITLNKKAYSVLKCEKEMQIVEGAGHLFEEPEKLDEVATLATNWFTKHLILNPKKVYK